MAQIKAKITAQDKGAKVKAKVTAQDKGKKVVAKAKTDMAMSKPTEDMRKAAAQKSGAEAAASKPKKFGEGDSTTRGGKANVSEAQLKASGMSLRAYMNAWKKTGKRPGAK